VCVCVPPCHRAGAAAASRPGIGSPFDVDRYMSATEHKLKQLQDTSTVGGEGDGASEELEQLVSDFLRQQPLVPARGGSRGVHVLEGEGKPVGLSGPSRFLSM